MVYVCSIRLYKQQLYSIIVQLYNSSIKLLLYGVHVLYLSEHLHEFVLDINDHAALTAFTAYCVYF